MFGALRAGASGFLLKGGEPSELLSAIRVVAAGDSLLAPSITRRLIEAFAAQPAPMPAADGIDELTPREDEVPSWWRRASPTWRSPANCS